MVDDDECNTMSPTGEPTTPQQVRTWIEQRMTALDRFVHVAEASESHREAHGCDTYPTGDGRLLGMAAAAYGTSRILEVGCGLGYSTLWLAWGGPTALVETIERDPVHAELAEHFFKAEGLDNRIHIHVDNSLEIVPALTGPYDLIFCDADIAQYPEELPHYRRLLRPRGVLVSANLFLGQYVPDVPGLDQAARYRERLLDESEWLTMFIGDKAFSVTRSTE